MTKRPAVGFRTSAGLGPLLNEGENVDTMEQKAERNFRVQARYDELMREGKHGHYETMFRVVREEVEAERARCVKLCDDVTVAMNAECPRAGNGWWPDQVGYSCIRAIQGPNVEVDAPEGSPRTTG